MSTTLPRTLDADAAAERLLSDCVAFTDFLSVHLGMELGLYAAMTGVESVTAKELADRARVIPRYAREWLEQQTVAGYLACPDPSAAPDDRRFVLPAGVATAFLDDTSEAFIGPLAETAGGVAAVVRDVIAAYRTGGGVPFHAYGHEVRHGLSQLNGAVYDGRMREWVEAMPDVAERLRSRPEPRILDLGCGTGRSTLALAAAYPRAVVRGVDLDAASIAEARAAAAAAGLAHRVTFVEGDAADVAAESFDLVTVFEALHDMGDPIGALRAARAAAAPDGTVYLVDERVADEFTPDADIAERMQYGFSVLHCLPATMAEDPVIAHGTILRRPTVEEWARAAGFSAVEVLPIEDFLWQHYRLTLA
jgi:ubiquinone/menaquinone biosynthesis C-methylase UbiE